MTLSEPFIRRPVGTTLLAVGLLLTGLTAYRFLPVASLPAVDLPTILVVASRPGADPSTMAASVAAPLERRLGAIAGVTELTSVSSLGQSRIILQFDLGRSVDGAAQDVQAALNAAATDLPGDLPTLPSLHKLNPAAAPVLILALTSDSIAPSDVYDAADTVLVQRLSQVEGVGQVVASGADQPAIRLHLDPARIAAMGVSTEAVRTAIANASTLGPLGSIDGPQTHLDIAANSQLRRPEDYRDILIKAADGTSIRLGDIATVEEGVRNSRTDAWFNGRPAVLLNVSKQANANVIRTVDSVKALLPELRRLIPAGIKISVLSDRTTTIHASIDDMQWTLLATIGLVMGVVLVFLRRLVPTAAAGVTVPLSLAGTLAAMWVCGFSIDNLSLMALAVSVGFVVDDAIVMIENIHAGLERGLEPIQAALEGAREIGFTVVSISLSLLAAFVPLLFMGGIVGRFLREFSLTLAFAVIVSTALSLTVTPMVCGHGLRTMTGKASGRLDGLLKTSLDGLTAAYGRTLRPVLHHRLLTVAVILGTVGLTAWLYVALPKGLVPQDDIGLVLGFTDGSTDISYPAMVQLQRKAAEIVMRDPAVASVGSSLGTSFSGAVNQGQLFIALKPLSERPSATQVIDRLRRPLAEVAGMSVFLFSVQEIRTGGRTSSSQFQFTLWDPDYAELVSWLPKVVERLKTVPGVVDVSTDRQPNGLEAVVTVDRDAASRLGVGMQDVDNALNNGFSQRQVATTYTQRNQYRVVLEIDPRLARDPAQIGSVHVPGTQGTQVPLTSIAQVERRSAPLVVNHQGQFPSVTISYNLGPGTMLDQVSNAVLAAVSDMHLPGTLHAEFAGDAAAARVSSGNQPLLVLAALMMIYIVLGVLYESLAHPLTIISTLPSAGLGALLALLVTGSELTIVAFIGIILLIGIVKKNGIMLVDFALEQERRHGASAEEAIFRACLMRFRPILMTTLASLLGAVPLILAGGAGSELRRPLGIAIFGGLIVSQVLTLYTTPVIYLMLDRLQRRWSAATGRQQRKGDGRLDITSATQ